MALHLNDIKFFTCFYVHKDLRLIRFLPAPTARNVLDFNQNSLHLDACMPLAHFAELLAFLAVGAGKNLINRKSLCT
jgi:hypothetical protein